MDIKATLLRTASAFCAASGMSKARLATLMANDGKFLRRVEAGGGFTVATFERSMQWLSDHWPVDTAWPAGVSRPQPAVAV